MKAKKYLVFDPYSGKSYEEEYTEHTDTIHTISVDMSDINLSELDLIQDTNDLNDNIIDFYVINSSGNNGYCVTLDFSFPEEGLIVECNCPAGVHGQLCKHKLQFLKGDRSIFDPEMEQEGFNEEKWSISRQWISACGLDSAVQEFEHRIVLLEAEKARISNKIRQGKKALAQQLSEGFKNHQKGTPNRNNSK